MCELKKKNTGRNYDNSKPTVYRLAEVMTPLFFIKGHVNFATFVLQVP